MKRKLGVALLIIATALAGTPEAVKQFHDLNRSLRAWASASLGGSFLVYAEGPNERTLPDRYDYHEVAPGLPRTTESDAASYGLMASFSLPEAPCPFAHRREASRAEAAPRAHAAAPRVALAQTARRMRTVTINVRADQLAREIERATNVAARALGTKLDARQFAALIKAQATDAKLKTWRFKTTTFKTTNETTRVRRATPVRIARLEEEPLPFVERFEVSAPMPPELALTRRGNEEENRPPAVPEEPAKRNPNGKVRTRPQRPGARSTESREFDVAPFVIMASTDGEVKGLDCNGKDNN